MNDNLSRKSMAVATLVMFSLMVFFGGQAYGQAESPLLRAQVLFVHGQYDEALSLLHSYIMEIMDIAEQKPDLAAAWYLLAKIYFEVGDDGKCDKALRLAFAALPGYDRDEPNIGFMERVLKVKGQLAGNAAVVAAPPVEPKASTQAAETKTAPTSPSEKKADVKATEVKSTSVPVVVTPKTEAPPLVQKEDTKTAEANASAVPASVVPKTGAPAPKVIPTSVEKQKSSAGNVGKKKKKFPWLLAVLGVGAVIAVIVLLLGNKDDNSSNIPQTPTKPQPPNIEMVSVFGGTFQMGSNSSMSFVQERPVHTVTLSPFQIGKYEVTQGQWEAVMGSNPSSFRKGDNYPVEMVSWDDVQTFIQKLNSMSGKQYRLPTEAEWEYACRAGTTGDRYGDLDSIAWYYINSFDSTHPVGQKLPNAWGLYDMLGNVWEWVNDWYGPYSSAPQTNPAGPTTGSERINRGGSFYGTGGPWFARAPYRNYLSPDTRTYILGFRLAASS